MTLEEKLQKAACSEEGDFSAKEEVIRSYADLMLEMSNIGEDRTLKDQYYKKAFEYLTSLVQEKIDFEIEQNGSIDDYALNDYIFKYCALLFDAKKGDAGFISKQQDEKQPGVLVLQFNNIGDISLEHVIYILSFNHDNAHNNYLLFTNEKNMPIITFFDTIADHLLGKHMAYGADHDYLYNMAYTLTEAALTGYVKYSSDLLSKIFYCKCVYNYFRLQFRFGEILGSTSLLKHATEVFKNTETLPEEAFPEMHYFIASAAMEIAENLLPRYYYNTHRFSEILNCYITCYKTAESNYEYLAELDSDKYSDKMISHVCNAAMEKLLGLYDDFYDIIRSDPDFESCTQLCEDSVDYFQSIKDDNERKGIS